MSRRQSTNRPSDQRPSRVVLKSLDVPKCSSAQIKICTNTRPDPQSDKLPSESPSVAEYYQELYSTSQSRSNSESHGPKAEHRDDSQNTKRHSCQDTCSKYQKADKAADESYLERESSSLEHVQFTNNHTSQVMSPDRSPRLSCSPRRSSIQPEHMAPSKHNRTSDCRRESLKRPAHEQIEEKMTCAKPCCFENEDEEDGKVDAGTYPIPDTAATGTCMTKCLRDSSSGYNDYYDESPSDQEESFIPPCSRKPPSLSPKATESCCAPPDAYRATDPRYKGSSQTQQDVVRKPSLKQNCACSDPSQCSNNQRKDCACCSTRKQSTEKINEKKHYVCPGTVKPPLKSTCTCHFPPTFYKYGCTGNISGNCNCSGN